MTEETRNEVGEALESLMAMAQNQFEKVSGLAMVTMPLEVAERMEESGVIVRDSRGFRTFAVPAGLDPE